MFGFKSAQQERIDKLALESSSWKRSAEYWETRHDEAETRANELLDKLTEAERAEHGADRTAAMYKKLYDGAAKTLAEIAAQETPTANATVKRMARMARKELPVLHHDAGHAPAPAASVGAL